MAKQMACGDVVPGCAYKAEAASEDELMKQVSAHAKESHGLAEVSPELAAKVKAAIKDR